METKKPDLSTRARVNVVLDKKIYARLKQYSKDTGIPMSRVLDRAIKAYLYNYAPPE